MESEFLSLCDYNIYVSAEKYEQYQAQVRRISFPNEAANRARRVSSDLQGLSQHP